MPDRPPVGPLNPYGAGPAVPVLEDALRYLERTHDDSKVRDALGKIRHVAVDGRSGLPVPCYVYRLECGHLVSIWHFPLPENVTSLYCAEGTCAELRSPEAHYRRIVELLAEDGMAGGL